MNEKDKKTEETEFQHKIATCLLQKYLCNIRFNKYEKACQIEKNINKLGFFIYRNGSGRHYCVAKKGRE